MNAKRRKGAPVKKGFCVCVERSVHVMKPERGVVMHVSQQDLFKLLGENHH